MDHYVPKALVLQTVRRCFDPFSLPLFFVLFSVRVARYVFVLFYRVRATGCGKGFPRGRKCALAAVAAASLRLLAGRGIVVSRFLRAASRFLIRVPPRGRRAFFEGCRVPLRLFSDGQKSPAPVLPSLGRIRLRIETDASLRRWIFFLF